MQHWCMQYHTKSTLDYQICVLASLAFWSYVTLTERNSLLHSLFIALKSIEWSNSKFSPESAPIKTDFRFTGVTPLSTSFAFWS